MGPFAIKYFDGRSSQLHEGLLNLHDHHWEITLFDEGGTYNKTVWQLAEIKKPEFVGGSNIFKYGEFPQQTLECHDPALLPALKNKYPKAKFFGTASSWALSAGFGLIGAIAIGIILLGFLFYKYAIPPMAEAFADKVPMEYEEKWGDTMLSNIIAPEKVAGDFNYKKNDSLTILANKFASKINFETKYKLKITVVSSGQINAFALPGGNVVVFDALLKKLKTKEEFAALLGHEVAHINKKHTLKNLFRSLSGYIFISLITSDINGISAVLFENANSIYNLSYSRELEAESDTYALKTMEKNNLNPIGLLNLFVVLEGANTAEPYEILSSHPLTKNRKDFARKHIIKNKSYPANFELENVWQQLKK
jgi:beta-barrel assembly-enhancing protease